MITDEQRRAARHKLEGAIEEWTSFMAQVAIQEQDDDDTMAILTNYILAIEVRWMESGMTQMLSVKGPDSGTFNAQVGLAVRLHRDILE